VVIAPFCQRPAYVVASPGGSEIPAIWPALLMAKATLFITPPKPGRLKTKPFRQTTA
jgi:hypothetical protein